MATRHELKALEIDLSGWFILGIVWLLNSTYCKPCPGPPKAPLAAAAGLYRLSLAVIFAAVARLLMTLIVFYHSFPPRFQGQGLPPKPRGASQELIDAWMLATCAARSGITASHRVLQSDRRGAGESEPLWSIYSSSKGFSWGLSMNYFLKSSEIHKAPLFGCWNAAILRDSRVRTADGGRPQETSCAVCLSDFERDAVLRRLPCGHCFHRSCIDKWLKRNKVCPLCLQDGRIWEL